MHTIDCLSVQKTFIYFFKKYLYEPIVNFVIQSV
jgi:hypothetical protein